MPNFADIQGLSESDVVKPAEHLNEGFEIIGARIVPGLNGKEQVKFKIRFYKTPDKTNTLYLSLNPIRERYVDMFNENSGLIIQRTMLVLGSAKPGQKPPFLFASYTGDDNHIPF